MASLAPQAYYQTPEHVVAACVALSVVNALFVGLRFWTRRKQNTAFRVDDWLMVPAMCLTITMSGLILYGVARESVAYHTQIPPDFQGNPLTLKTEQLSLTSRIEYGCTLMLPIALGCIKMSFLFFYLRIFAVNRKSGISYMLQGMIGLVLLWTVIFFFEKVFECGLDHWAVWGSTVDMMEHCLDTMQVVLWLCITDFVSDVIIILIPVPLIWRLKLSRPKKIATTAVFLLGIVTVAASLCRLVFAALTVSQGFDPKADEILTITQYLYWGLIESGVGVFAACLPTISFLFRHSSSGPIFSKTKSLFSSQKSQSTQKDKTAALHTTDSSSSDSGMVPMSSVGLGLTNAANQELDASLRGNSSDDPILADVESVISRGSNRLNGDSSNIDSYTTDSSWRTRVDSIKYEESLAPPPPAHHMKDFHSNPL